LIGDYGTDGIPFVEDLRQEETDLYSGADIYGTKILEEEILF
jgi:hypothetical protein